MSSSRVFSPQLLAKARGIKLLALDVDGVLTNGSLYFGNQGEELKSFNILDGLGIKLLQDNGVSVAIITGRQSTLVAKRASDLNIKYVIQGREDKLTALNELLKKLNLTLDQAAYMGDDLPDLAAIIQCRLGITVASAYPFVKDIADWITDKSGGEGAVREVSDLILSANEKLNSILESYCEQPPNRK